VTLPAEQLGARLSDRRAVIIAWIAWAVLLAVVCGVILAGSKRTVTPYYTEAALSWTEGSDIYRGSGTGFLYCPQAAIAFVPFAWLPTTPREIAWRVLTIGVFAAGVWRLSRLAGRRGGPVLTPFPIVTLLSVPVVVRKLTRYRPPPQSSNRTSLAPKDALSTGAPPDRGVCAPGPAGRWSARSSCTCARCPRASRASSG